MNQRCDWRYAADQPVWVTVYGEVDARIEARVRNASGRGVGLAVAQPIGVGLALKIEIPDGFLLGEVIYCREEDGAFQVGVELEQALYGLVELARTVSGFVEQPSTAEQHNAMQHARRQHGQ